MDKEVIQNQAEGKAEEKAPGWFSNFLNKHFPNEKAEEKEEEKDALQEENEGLKARLETLEAKVSDSDSLKNEISQLKQASELLATQAKADQETIAKLKADFETLLNKAEALKDANEGMADELSGKVIDVQSDSEEGEGKEAYPKFDESEQYEAFAKRVNKVSNTRIRAIATKK